MTRPLILFLGNSILADDRIGLIIGEMLKERLESEGKDVEIIEKIGYSLLDYIEGRESVIIVDSVITGRHRIGEIVSLTPDDLQRFSPSSSHYAGIPELLNLMRQLELVPPLDFRVIGIEVEDPYAVSTKISKRLETEVNQIAEAILKMISTPNH
jgi:hydrogenase maturation protease